MEPQKHPGYPARVYAAIEAERRYPDLYPELVPALFRLDPLADAAAAALAALPPERRHAEVQSAVHGKGASTLPLVRLVESARELFEGVDSARLDEAGRIVRRSGVLGGLVLGLRSLVHGYAAPAGNKPLALSGVLVQKAERRLAETAKFVAAVTAPRSLRPFEEGFAITLSVRLMHAQVRRLCLEHPSWDSARFGLPINQHDMLATILLFSCVFVDGIRSLGVQVSQAEADNFQYLYAHVGRLIGVEEGLLPHTFDEATRRAEFVHFTQAPPDSDSRVLVHALLAGPTRRASSSFNRRMASAHRVMVSGLCRYLIGNPLADELKIPLGTTRLPWLFVKKVVSLLEWWREIGHLDTEVEELGGRYLEFVVRQGLGDEAARFRIPDGLDGQLSR